MDRDEARRSIERSEEAIALRVEALAGRAGRRAKQMRQSVQTVRKSLDLRDQSRRHPLALFAASAMAGWCLYVVVDRQRAKRREHTWRHHRALRTTEGSLVQHASRSAVSALVAALVSGLVRIGFSALTFAAFGSQSKRSRLRSENARFGDGVQSRPRLSSDAFIRSAPAIPPTRT